MAKKVNGVSRSLWEPVIELRVPAVRSHSVTCHLRQVNTLQFNPSQAACCLIDVPRRDGRLS